MQTISDLLEQLVASLLTSSTLLQDDNNLFKTCQQLGTSSAKHLVDKLRYFYRYYSNSTACYIPCYFYLRILIASALSARKKSCFLSAPTTFLRYTPTLNTVEKYIQITNRKVMGDGGGQRRCGRRGKGRSCSFLGGGGGVCRGKSMHEI